MLEKYTIDSVLLLDQPGNKQWGSIVGAMKPGAHLLLFSDVGNHHLGAIAAEDNGLEIRDTIAWVFADEGNDVGMMLITVARKPLEGTVAENTLRYGTGGINVDACRVELKDGDNKSARYGHEGKRSTAKILSATPLMHSTPDGKGRWPANLLHCGSEGVKAMFPKTNKQALCKSDDKSGWQSDYVGGSVSKPITRVLYLDDDNGGSAARFFYSAPCLNDLCNYLIKLVTPLSGTILTDHDTTTLPSNYTYVTKC